MRIIDLLITGASELVTMRSPNGGIVADGAVAVEGGKIAAVGTSRDLTARYRARRTIDAGGCVVTPGLIDSHTHLIFAGTREREFEMRCRGASYMEIAKAGGGILSTVRSVRGATKKALTQAALKRLAAMRALGTTTVEAKSGYGLNLDDEVKMLETIADLNRMQAMEVVPTFLGAHEVPPEYKGRTEAYVRFVVDEVIPEVGRRRLARFCDVFCEEGVFSVAQTRRILNTAKRHGMRPRFHADEFACLEGAVLAAEVGAASADHLLAVSDRGIRALKRGRVTATLLPGTSFFLGLGRYAPARKMIAAGVRVALASDFNPGSCPSFSLPLVMTLACTQMKMTPMEALAGCTIHAARSLMLDHAIGSLECGKRADIVIWKAENYRTIPYRFGENLVKRTIIRGK